MKIILKKDVKNVGLQNQIVEVSDGFAINSLIPKKLAVLATKLELAKLNQEKKEHHIKLKKEAQIWLKIKKEIESKIFVVFKKSKDGILINNISRKHLLKIINQDLSLILNKNQLLNKYDFNLGINSYPIQLYPGIKAIASINIKEEINE